jgi:vacuolar-type H+-ATPase catalytic subunit A/Vma1
MINALPNDITELLTLWNDEAQEGTNPFDGVVPFLKARFEADRTGTILSLAKYIQNLNAEHEAVDAKAKQLAQRAKAIKAKAEWYKAQVELVIQAGEKLKDDTIVVSTRTSQKVNLLVDETDLPDNLSTIKTTKSANKTLLKELLDVGDEEAKKVAVIQTNINLTIK